MHTWCIFFGFAINTNLRLKITFYDEPRFLVTYLWCIWDRTKWLNHSVKYIHGFPFELYVSKIWKKENTFFEDVPLYCNSNIELTWYICTTDFHMRNNVLPYVLLYSTFSMNMFNFILRFPQLFS